MRNSSHPICKNYDNTMGFSLSDFYQETIKPQIEVQTQALEEMVKEEAKSVLPPEIYAQGSALLNTEGARIGESLEQKAKAIAMEQAEKYAQKPEVQESAIRGGITAAADKISNFAVDFNKTYQTHGFKAVFNKYPAPFYIAGGVATLITLRFILGGRKKVYVQKGK